MSDCRFGVSPVNYPDPDPDMRKDTLEFAKEKSFSGHSDTRSVQESFYLLTSFIQVSADKHIPPKTSRSVSYKLMQRQKDRQ